MPSLPFGCKTWYYVGIFCEIWVFRSYHLQILLDCKLREQEISLNSHVPSPCTVPGTHHTLCKCLWMETSGSQQHQHAKQEYQRVALYFNWRLTCLRGSKTAVMQKSRTLLCFFTFILSLLLFLIPWNGRGAWSFPKNLIQIREKSIRGNLHSDFRRQI